MVIIPRKIFDQMSPKALTEAEDSTENFNVIKFLKGMNEVDRLQWLKKNAAWVGTGSSRTTFILNDMTALKIAHNNRGIGQNRQEYLNTVDENGNGKYSCFSEIYDVDKNDWEMLRVEAASVAKESDFKHSLGLSYAGEAIMIPVALSICKGDVKRLMISDILIKKVIDSIDDMSMTTRKEFLNIFNSPRITEIIYRISKGRPKVGSETNIASIYKFFVDNGIEKMVPADLTNNENWGTVWRNGINQLIIIDSGFSEDVWERYYTTA